MNNNMVVVVVGKMHLKNLYLSSMNCDSRRYTAHVRIPSRDRFCTSVGRNG